MLQEEQMTSCKEVISYIFGFFSHGKAVFFLSFYRGAGKQAVMGLVLSFICFFPGRVYAQTGQNGWFWPDAVICEIDTGTPVDFGRVDGTLSSPASLAGKFQVQCSSQAYRTADQSTDMMAEAAFCLTIQGEAPRYLVNTRDPAYKIPFNFYHSAQGDSLPAGNGAQGNPIWSRGQRSPGNVIGSPVIIPLEGAFVARIDPAKLAVPAGIYKGTFTIELASGARLRGDYPNMNTPYACAAFPVQGVVGKVTVVVTIEDSCNINISQHVNFPRTAWLYYALRGQGVISVRCSDKTKFQVGMDKGLHGDSPRDRLMKVENGRGATISYNLYKDSAGSEVWTDEWNTPNVLHDTGTGQTRNYVVYGIVPPQGPYKPYGTYSDTVLVEIRVE